MSTSVTAAVLCHLGPGQAPSRRSSLHIPVVQMHEGHVKSECALT